MEDSSTRADIERLFGQVVRLCGMYHRADPLDLRKKQVRRENEPTSRRVWIILKDKTQVLIEPTWANGDRSEEEIRCLEGKMVAVIGTIRSNSPEITDRGDYPLQSLGISTIRRVESISEIFDAFTK